MTAPNAPDTRVRDAIASLDTRFDDVRREQTWRAVERGLADRPPASPPARVWRLPVFALAVTAVVVALLFAPRPDRASPSPAAEPPTALAAIAGQRTVFERDGLTLTLVGPATATLRQEPGAIHVTVTHGLVVADRTPTAPPLDVEAGANRVVSRDARFAVRVEPTMIVLGAGAQAQQIVERHALDVATPATAPNAGSPNPGASNVDASTAGASNVGPSNVDASNVASSVGASNLGTPNTTRNSEPNGTPSIASNAGTSKSRPPTAAAYDRTATSRASESNVGASATDAANAPDTDQPPTLPDLRMDAAELYKRAEAALAVRDPESARDFLERLLREYPTDARVDAARYDLALIARASNQRGRARALLDELIAHGKDSNLVAAARRLRPSL